MPSQSFAVPRDVSRQVSEIILPPKRIKPTDAIERWLRTEKGPWHREQSPMMCEVLDQLASRLYQGIVFVGPSRSGKTFTLVMGGITYIVTCAPGDVQITQQNQDECRKWSKTDLARGIEYSDELRKRLSPRPRDDNVFDKFFTSGMMLQLAWPTASQHSSKTLKYIFITDYDQAPNHQNVDQRGTLWNLAFTRIRTYMSRGKCLAESSPGDDLMDPAWRPTSPHEAPPVTGILEVYNLGTRARWYWQCMHCREYFEASPGTELFNLPTFEELEEEVKKKDLMSLADHYARIGCPHCGGMHEMEHRQALNAAGRWLHAGETIDASGRIIGERRRTNIASYWQGGITATFQQWNQLLFRYFQAIQSFVQTGSDKTLKTVTNTDLGMPYLPRAIAKRRGAEELMKRVESWPQGFVPKGVRFLTAAVDIQAHSFVFTTIGWGVNGESWLVDRFKITASKRMEADRNAALDPASFLEDWDLIKDAIIRKTYPCEEHDTYRMPVLLTLCDSGGKKGVTPRAYEFWRRLRKENLHQRLMLVKGDHRINMPQVSQTWPEAKERKDRAAGAMGDVLVWLVNVNMIKDTVAADLGRDEPGPRYHHIPDWIDKEYFDEILAETKTKKGWMKEQQVRNEALDLHVYNVAAHIILKAHSINWDSPPYWATPITVRTNGAPPPSSNTNQRRVRSRGIQR